MGRLPGGVASAAVAGFSATMLRPALFLSLTFACGATSVAAQEVAPCDWRARADAIVEPWETYSRTFAGGAVRVALLDTVEPAAAAFHLLILTPPFDELGQRTCSVVSYDGSLGFTTLDFAEMEAAYDPARGLTLTLPGGLHAPEAEFGDRLKLSVTINQATGEIAARIAPGRD